jgi:regulator of sigma E protease
VKAGSAAAQAGFLANDLITHVGGKEVFEAGTMSDWAEAHPGEPMVVTVDRAGTTAEVTFSPKGVLVESVMPDGPAATAGLKAGDRILSADGKPIAVSSVLIKEINSAVDRAVALEIEREGAKQQVTVKPRLPVTDLEGEKPKPSIGVVLVGLEASHGITFDMYGKLTPIYPTPTEQVKAGVSSIVNTVDAVTSRKSSISVQHMGGPVMMMRIYYLLFQSPEGWRMALWFSVVLNINLALLNMLPLPVLDGGHIVLAIVEGVRRKPVNIRVLEYVQTGCALLIIGFMIFVTFFDIQDVFGGGSKKKGFHFEKAPAEAPK